MDSIGKSLLGVLPPKGGGSCLVDEGEALVDIKVYCCSRGIFFVVRRFLAIFVTYGAVLDSDFDVRWDLEGLFEGGKEGGGIHAFA